MSQHLPFSERTERVILAIIVADLLLQGAETVPALADAARFFHWAGVATWLVFTVEWFLRIRRADNWRKYAFSFFGIMDFLAILPLWLLTGFDLKALRAFRLFRLVRATGKLAGRGNAVAKLARAFNFAKDEAGALFSGTAVIIVTTGFGMYHLEHRVQPEVFSSALDGLWWKTLVGFGDVRETSWVFDDHDRRCARDQDRELRGNLCSHLRHQGAGHGRRVSARGSDRHRGGQGR